MDAHANLAVSLVATAPSPASSGTSLVVTAAQGARFPAVPFNASIWPAATQPDPSNCEIVRVTARSTDTLTITRAQEGTSARTVVVGDQIAATITAKTLTDVEASAFHPRWLTGKYYGTLDFGASASLTMVVNTTYYTPLWVPNSCSIDLMGFNCNSVIASSTVRLGIYNDNGSTKPGTVLLDAGTVATAVGTGEKSIAVSQALTGGTLYWLSATQQGGASGIGVDCNSANTAGLIMMPNTSILGVARNLGMNYAETGISGALATAGTLTLGNQHPRCVVRVA